MSTDIPDSGGGEESRPEPTPPSVPAALAATEQPVELSVRLVTDERVPDDMVCMGTYRGERLVARCVLPPEAWQEIQEFGLFSEPVPVVLVAREAMPGLQCQLFALLPVPEGIETDEDDGDEGENEPWAASVPGSGYEAAADESAADDGDEETGGDIDDADATDVQVIAFPLGNIVRYDRDRVHPESLPLEAADVLRKIIEGQTTEMVDRALADLFGL